MIKNIKSFKGIRFKDADKAPYQRSKLFEGKKLRLNAKEEKFEIYKFSNCRIYNCTIENESVERLIFEDCSLSDIVIKKCDFEYVHISNTDLFDQLYCSNASIEDSKIGSLIIDNMYTANLKIYNSTVQKTAINGPVENLTISNNNANNKHLRRK